MAFFYVEMTGPKPVLRTLVFFRLWSPCAQPYFASDGVCGYANILISEGGHTQGVRPQLISSLNAVVATLGYISAKSSII